MNKRDERVRSISLVWSIWSVLLAGSANPPGEPKKQDEQDDERGGQALGGGAVFALLPSSNGVGKIGGTGPKL